MVAMKLQTLLFSSFFLLFSCTIKVGNKPVEKSEQNFSKNKSSEVSGDIFSYIGPGDILKITVYGESDLSGEYQVSLNKSIMFPFIGEISVEGLSNITLASMISDKLREGYLTNPQVTVFIQEFVSKRIFVLGQVKKSGNFPMRNEMSVIEAVSLAGGFTDFADINNVVVTRKEDGKEVRFVVNIRSIVNGQEENFYLQPGDIIFVRERFF
jgi:protein involved in polysaccharide export with SLBB domain